MCPRHVVQTWEVGNGGSISAQVCVFLTRMGFTAIEITCIGAPNHRRLQTVQYLEYVVLPMMILYEY